MNNFGDGIRERKTAEIEIRGGCPGKKLCSGALIGRETAPRKVLAARGLKQVGPKALECHCPGAQLLDFPQARRDSTQSDHFNNRSYCAAAASHFYINGLWRVGGKRRTLPFRSMARADSRSPDCCTRPISRHWLFLSLFLATRPAPERFNNALGELLRSASRCSALKKMSRLPGKCW